MAELDLTQMREDIDAEVARATEKERVLQSKIDGIVDTVGSVEDLGNRLDTEIAERKISDSTETAARIAADDSLSEGKADVQHEHEAADITDMEDFVVAYGTSGIWQYRKWNSGFAECWATLKIADTTVTAAWGNSYASDKQTAFTAYPFVFVSEPNVTHSAKAIVANNTTYAVLSYTFSNTGNDAKVNLPKMGILRSTAITYTVNVYVNVQVCGRWK